MLFICGPRIFGFSSKDAARLFNIFYGLSPTVLCLNHINLGLSPLGGVVDLPHLLHPNARDLYLLLFYTTMSLDFGRGPIFELNTHSPRMMNNSTMHPHPTRRDVTVHMNANMSFMLCHVTCIMRATCNIINTWIIIIFLHIIHIHQQSMLYISTQYFHTQHVI